MTAAAGPAPAPSPRDIITQDAFAVAPHLLGLPLARPWRRFAAMALDLAIVGLLVNVGGKFLLAAVAVYVFLRMARHAPGGRLVPRPVRIALKATAATLAFVLALSCYNKVFDRGEKGGAGERAARSVAWVVAPGNGKLADVIAFGADLSAIKNATNEAEARRAAVSFAGIVGRNGASPAEVRAALEDLAGETDNEVSRAALLAHARELQGKEPAPPGPDSLAAAYAAAVAARDSVAADTLADRVGALLAADTVKALQTRVSDLQEERNGLKGELEDAREKVREAEEAASRFGIVGAIKSIADDLGIGFGWTGLYFTGFLAFWKGSTPGKRIMGIRVLRLSGAPMTLWTSFERFGGYAASIVTGLLGFAQIWWDRNRQGIHDKIVETVVVWEGGSRVAPEPAPAAAAARRPFEPRPFERRPFDAPTPAPRPPEPVPRPDS